MATAFIKNMHAPFVIHNLYITKFHDN